MREIDSSIIRENVKKLLLDASYDIGKPMMKKLMDSYEREELPLGKYVLKQIIDNDEIAKAEKIPMCQDTGMAVVFIELGDRVLITGGNLFESINEGIRDAYIDGYLRKSVVDDPLFERKNTNDNTPGIIHLEIVKGDKINITVAPKGFGSENMSAVKMLKPADGVDGVKDFVIETVKKAGPNPCPPIIVGVGIGGTFEKSAILAKKSLTREIGLHNKDDRYKKLEEELLEEINKLNIGPGGFGGQTTALGVNIEYFPTHIAGMPVAVNICCHAYRHGSIEI